MENKTNGRLMSLDALRGFDMFFIMGGQGLIYAVAALLGYPDFRKVFGHVPWDGLQFVDTIFPLFLFIAGVTFPFSAAKRMEKGASKGLLAWHSIRRGLTLILFGYVFGSLLKFDFAHLRAYGVLQHIGFCWMVAALIFLAFKRNARIVIAVTLLVGSWMLFRFVGAPDANGALPFTPEGNLGCWFDRTVFGPNHIYQKIFDPEGAAGFLPGIVTPMLGMFAGEFLRSGLSGSKKVLCLVIAGAVSVVTGLLMSLSIPIVKALWTSSFVLVCGGYSAIMLALFYWVIDVKGWTGWTFFFKVIGMNSITIYLGQRIIPFGAIRDFFLGGVVSLVPADIGAIISNAGYIAACWLFLYFLYRKQVFLKV